MNTEERHAYLREEAIDERRERANRTRCACSNPDWPGQCPGPLNCPVNNYGEQDDAE